MHYKSFIMCACSNIKYNVCKLINNLAVIETKNSISVFYILKKKFNIDNRLILIKLYYLVVLRSWLILIKLAA